MNNFWLKKIGIFGLIFLLAIIFNLNKSKIYQAQTDILFLPKNEISVVGLNVIIENFQQILTSVAFNDRISENNDALTPGIELPNYKRKEFWNSKITVAKTAGGGSVLRIKNFDADINLAQELNNDTVENLIVIAGNYYNVKTDLELRIIDGPTVKKIASQNLWVTFEQSALWSLGIYFALFFLLPFIFIKKEKNKRTFPEQNFSHKLDVPKKITANIIPEEENYFATKNFFGQTKKMGTEKQKHANNFILPNFSSLGKKAVTPANLPVSEEDIPDIFRQKETYQKESSSEKGEKSAQLIEKNENKKEDYIPHEPTSEEVKARLNRLLAGEK